MLKRIGRRLALSAIAVAIVAGAGLPILDARAAEAAAYQPGGAAPRYPVQRPDATRDQRPAAQPEEAVPTGVALSARVAVASSLGVPVREVVLETGAAVIWSDSSLGCRQAGRMYAQVVTPGFRIIASAGSRRVEVHTDATRGRAVVCRSPGQ